ncbi:sodium:calcium antiporter [Pseudobacteroides cellulosolvens]|uniref:Sodium/calcium exchanger membrane region n=2 Tax=Pseudobacteroides cellulosolvens TaxID=35825 RepID=A0A0L6JM05_9FIRM|nr:sodium:calcium antiporter [Pseudobacteroides cellulosolvens]KNY26783.1 sodium/calcium exchanger membrane region [Pseudobacteroides cellulosolvens ATCC 35603 = DSM 2933]
MQIYIILLFLGLIIILLSCELFTNAIEWFGKKLNFGDGVIGSIFSAVGTCLPETLIPIIAIIKSGKSGEDSSLDVGIGAILGAPFMLSTLAFFITGFSVILFCKKRKSGLSIKINKKIFGRDMEFFALMYSIAITMSFIENYTAKVIISIGLILMYVYYVFLTVKHDKTSVDRLEKLYILKFSQSKVSLTAILLQLSIALTGIVSGSYIFVSNIEGISQALKISPMILALIITPIATELPEKFNSIIWIRKGKDSLALGNISGAMVFQSCIPVAVGIVFTTWKLNNTAMVSCVLSLVSSVILLLWMKVKKELTPLPFIFCGVLYILFIIYLTNGVFH